MCFVIIVLSGGPDKTCYLSPENFFTMPKLLYFLRTSPCFLQNDFLERCDNLIRNSLCKVTYVKMDDSFYKQFFRQPKVDWVFLPLVY